RRSAATVAAMAAPIATARSIRPAPDKAPAPSSIGTAGAGAPACTANDQAKTTAGPYWARRSAAESIRVVCAHVRPDTGSGASPGAGRPSVHFASRYRRNAASAPGRMRARASRSRSVSSRFATRAATTGSLKNASRNVASSTSFPSARSMAEPLWVASLPANPPASRRRRRKPARIDQPGAGAHAIHGASKFAVQREAFRGYGCIGGVQVGAGRLLESEPRAVEVDHRLSATGSDAVRGSVENERRVLVNPAQRLSPESRRPGHHRSLTRDRQQDEEHGLGIGGQPLAAFRLPPPPPHLPLVLPPDTFH